MGGLIVSKVRIVWWSLLVLGGGNDVFFCEFVNLCIKNEICMKKIGVKMYNLCLRGGLIVVNFRIVKIMYLL